MKAILTAAWTAVLFIASLPAAAHPVAAKPFEDVRHVTVDYSDLDLSKAHGQRTLNERVRGAVRQACAGSNFTLGEKMEQSRCIGSAQTQASGDVANAIARAENQRSLSNWDKIDPRNR